MSTNILRLPQVIERCGIRRSSIYAQMNAGKFPKPIQLGLRAVGWVDSDIDEWLQGKISASRGSNGSVPEMASQRTQNP